MGEESEGGPVDWNGDPLQPGYYSDMHGDGLYYLAGNGSRFRVIPLDVPGRTDLKPWNLVVLEGTNVPFRRADFQKYMAGRNRLTQRIMDFEDFERPRLKTASSQE